MYRIIGINRFFVKEEYWRGKDLKECLAYLNHLKTTTALDTVRFRYEYQEDKL